MRYRKLANGSLAFPIRGEPPKQCPEGYIKDINDPWVCKPIEHPCIFRIISEYKTDCCTNKMKIDCSHFNKEITLGDCVGCVSRQS